MKRRLHNLHVSHVLPVTNGGTNEPVGHAYPGKTPNTLAQIYRMVKRFPANTIVLAHWGGGLFFFNLLRKEVKEQLRNVYFDTAASPFLYDPAVYRVGQNPFRKRLPTPAPEPVFQGDGGRRFVIPRPGADLWAERRPPVELLKSHPQGDFVMPVKSRLWKPPRKAGR